MFCQTPWVLTYLASKEDINKIVKLLNANKEAWPNEIPLKLIKISPMLLKNILLVS